MYDFNESMTGRLNASYTFDRFIEGDCNQLARRAALAIAQHPGQTGYNPLTVYGGVGLGKTHLIQAIGNYVWQHGDERVVYLSSERFTQSYMQSIQERRLNEFGRFYRKVDLLIIDDIQFFGGKKETQEEFAHVFNVLHHSGKQIVLSTDRPPREIDDIEERLLSRFQGGLVVDLQPPELETRIAILNRRVEDDGVDIPRDVIEFIAHHVKENIRELEGALVRLLAHATLHRCTIDQPLVQKVLSDLVVDGQPFLTIGEIQRATCDYFGVPLEQVLAKGRKREIVLARHVAMYFSKELTQHTLKTIGLYFGGRDHSTVINACRKVEDMMKRDPALPPALETIRERIMTRRH